MHAFRFIAHVFVFVYMMAAVHLLFYYLKSSLVFKMDDISQEAGAVVSSATDIIGITGSRKIAAYGNRL